MAPMARFDHGRLQAQVTALFEPLGARAGLLVSGPFNLGQTENFRVPDGGLHRGEPDSEAVYLDTAAVVVEIISPGDETYDKLPFYAAHGVDEVAVVDPAARRVRMLVRSGDHYRDVEASAPLGVRAAELGAALRWP
ncbi:MAG: Uma2 family endonuclease [Acidimicrobiales bacterium]